MEIIKDRHKSIILISQIFYGRNSDEKIELKEGKTIDLDTFDHQELKLYFKTKTDGNHVYSFYIIFK